MDEHERREIDELMRVEHLLTRWGVVSVIRGEGADSVAGALADMEWRGEFLRDVSDDLDQL